MDILGSAGSRFSLKRVTMGKRFKHHTGSSVTCILFVYFTDVTWFPRGLLTAITIYRDVEGIDAAYHNS